MRLYFTTPSRTRQVELNWQPAGYFVISRLPVSGDLDRPMKARLWVSSQPMLGFPLMDIAAEHRGLLECLSSACVESSDRWTRSGYARVEKE